MKPSSGLGASASSTTTVSLNVVDTLAGFAGFDSQISSIADASGKDAAAFKNFSSNGGVGSVADVYIGQKRIGRIGADLISPFVFSPQNGFAAARIETDFGAYDKNFGIYLIDFSVTTSSIVKPPKSESDYQGNDPRFTFGIPYLESFSWNNEKSLVVTFYFVGASYDENTQKTTYYRISPKQVWNYDLTTRKYTLIKTLPEAGN